MLTPQDLSTGFAIITWNNPKKLEKPCITNGHFLSTFRVIFSCNKVLRVDPDQDLPILLRDQGFSGGQSRWEKKLGQLDGAWVKLDHFPTVPSQNSKKSLKAPVQPWKWTAGSPSNHPIFQRQIIWTIHQPMTLGFQFLGVFGVFAPGVFLSATFLGYSSGKGLDRCHGWMRMLIILTFGVTHTSYFSKKRPFKTLKEP